MSLGLKRSLSIIILKPKSPNEGGGMEQIVLVYTSHSKRQQEVIFERLVDLRRDIIDRDK